MVCCSWKHIDIFTSRIPLVLSLLSSLDIFTSRLSLLNSLDIFTSRLSLLNSLYIFTSRLPLLNGPV